MNILLITPYIPYPLSEGGSISQYAVLEYLQRQEQVSLVVPIHFDWDVDRINGLRKQLPRVQIHSIDLRMPQTKLSLSQKAGTLLVRIARKLGISSQSDIAPEVAAMRDRIQFDQLYTPHFVEKLLNIVRRAAPDIIQVDMLSYIGLGSLLPEQYKKIFVHHELGFAILSTENETKGRRSDYDNYRMRYLRTKETGLLNTYDGIIVFSDADKVKIAHYVQPPVFAIPFPVLDSAFIPLQTENIYPIGKLVFIGGEQHLPNKDGVEWFIQNVGRPLFKETGWTLHVIGNWSPETKEKYKSNPAVIFAGYVEDITAYCRNSIMVVPIRIGSGIRTKILYAMAQGVPVVSTTIGAEGIPNPPDKETVIIADTAASFTTAIKALAQDKDKIISLARNAQAMVHARYSQTSVGEARLACYRQIIHQNKA